MEDGGRRIEDRSSTPFRMPIFNRRSSIVDSLSSILHLRSSSGTPASLTDPAVYSHRRGCDGAGYPYGLIHVGDDDNRDSFIIWARKWARQAGEAGQCTKKSDASPCPTPGWCAPPGWSPAASSRPSLLPGTPPLRTTTSASSPAAAPVFAAMPFSNRRSPRKSTPARGSSRSSTRRQASARGLRGRGPTVGRAGQAA